MEKVNRQKIEEKSIIDYVLCEKTKNINNMLIDEIGNYRLKGKKGN